MAHVILPGYLEARLATPPAPGASHDSLEVDGATAGDVLLRLEREHPRLAGWVLDEQGRLRRHVQVFRGDSAVDLAAPLESGDRLYVVAAISGGRPAEAPVELLVGTRKGLLVLRGSRGERLQVTGRVFQGESVEYALRDPVSGRLFASVTHGQYGPHLFYTDGDPLGQWHEAEGPAFPADVDAAVSRIWVIEPGEGGTLWAGVAPAALFRSDDGGASWALVRGLWDVPGRGEWQAGAGGLCLHSICPWPGEPGKLAVGISAAGVWRTEDGGDTWQWGVEGLVPRYVPEEARATTTAFCVHKLRRAPLQPETIYMQFHGGVYRSDDAGASWVDVAHGLPADFGFPLAIDPHDPDRAFVIPLIADVDRVTPEGKLRVYETRDRGASWRPLASGLPQEDTWLTVLRQAFADDGREPLGLYFGAESGEVFATADGGLSWYLAAEHLPPIHSVRAL